MKKKAALFLALVLLLTAVCGAGAENTGDTEGQQQVDPSDLAGSGAGWDGEYDPASEEDGDTYVSGTVYDDYGNAVYAGATPIPLDPIDMPSPTPKPELAFSFGPVEATNLGISFEAPQGWLVDTSSPDAIVLMDPQTHDGVNAQLTVRITNVSADYKLADVQTEVRNILKDIGQYNYSSWNPTNLAKRTLLKKDGYYVDYDGTYYDGTKVWGRVMVALLDNNRIITVHLSAPSGFGFKTVITHFRDTLESI